MSTKVKRYGWRKNLGNGEAHMHEYATKKERDADRNLDDLGWTKYSVLRTPAKPKGRPLWWAIRQLQEGRAVVDGEGETWAPGEMGLLWQTLYECGPEGFAQSWTLAVQP